MSRAKSTHNVVSINSGGHRARVLARRDRLVEENMDLVAPIARQIALSLPASFEMDDLISAAYLGLVKAATRYRPAAHGDTPFSAYARPVIRGAILDSVKRSNWAYAKGKTGDDIPETPVVIPIDETIDARRRRQRIDHVLGGLDGRYRDVVNWHYDSDLSLREVGERLGVGESRASQLHMEAVRELREALS